VRRSVGDEIASPRWGFAMTRGLRQVQGCHGEESFKTTWPSVGKEIASTTPLRFSLDEQFSQNKILSRIIEHSPHENSTNQAYNNFFENTFDWDLDFTFLHETVNTVIVT